MIRCNFFLPLMRLMPTDVSSRRGARPIAVEPQVFDLLVHLVQNRDRISSTSTNSDVPAAPPPLTVALTKLV